MEYVLGLRKKCVKTLEKDFRPRAPEEILVEAERAMRSVVEKDPVLTSRTERGKWAIALLLATDGRMPRQVAEWCSMNVYTIRGMIALLKSRGYLGGRRA